MRRSLATMLLAALISAAGLLGASPAAACSCGVADTATYFADADAVFTGSLVSRDVDHPDWPLMGSEDPALHVFTVHEVFKGQVHEVQGVVSAAESPSCGLTIDGEGPYVVFASVDPALPDGQFRAGSCGGTERLHPPVTAELEALASSSPPESGAAGLQDAGFSPVAIALMGVAALAVTAVGGLLVRRRQRSRAMR